MISMLYENKQVRKWMGKRINRQNQSNMLHIRRDRILLHGWVIGSGRLEGRLRCYIASK